MLCTAATPRPPAISAPRDKYRLYGVMSEGTIRDSLDFLRMALPSVQSIRPIDRSNPAFVSDTASLSPIRGGYAQLRRQSARGGTAVYQQGTVGMTHVIQVGSAVAV